MTTQRDDGALSTADMVAAANGAHDGAARQMPEGPTPADSYQPEMTTSGPRSAGDGAARRAGGNGAASVSEAGQLAASLFTGDENERFRSRWEEVQTGFVDEPRQAVEQADHLVAEVMKRIAELFAEERQGLEAQWNRGGDVDTEALRMALKRYRSFFERLLST